MLLVTYGLINHDPSNPRFEGRDRVVVSMGHISPGVYSTLAEYGYFTEDDFLSGFSLRDSLNFDDWQFFQAEGLRREWGAALERLVGCLLCGLCSGSCPVVHDDQDFLGPAALAKARRKG